MSRYSIKPGSAPPRTSVNRVGCRHSSEPVLAWLRDRVDSFGPIPGRWAVCIYYKDNYGGGWHTDCGQEWDVTDDVECWTNLPKPLSKE